MALQAAPSSTTSAAPSAITDPTTVTPYDTFIDQVPGLIDVHGPWRKDIYSQDISVTSLQVYSTTVGNLTRMVAVTPTNATNAFLLVEVTFSANVSVDPSKFVTDNGLVTYSFSLTHFFSDFRLAEIRLGTLSGDLFASIDARVGEDIFSNNITVSNFTDPMGNPEPGSRVTHVGSISLDKLNATRNVINLSTHLGYPSHGGSQFYVEDAEFRITNARVSSPPGSSSTLPAGAIAGIAVGGVVIAVLLVIAIFLYRRRQRKKEERKRLAQQQQQQQQPPQRQDSAEKKPALTGGDVTETTIVNSAGSPVDLSERSLRPIAGQEATSPNSEVSASKPRPESTEITGPWYSRQSQGSPQHQDVTAMSRLDE